MIKSVILISGSPLNVIVLDWQSIPRKKIYEQINFYRSIGYCVLVEKILHRRDHSTYRKVVYAANESARVSVWYGC